MLVYRRPFVYLAFLVLAAVSLPVTSSARRRKTLAPQTPVAASAAPRRNEAYGKLPLAFEVNQGQTDGRVKFVSRGAGYTLFLTANEAVLRLRKALRSKRFDEERRLSRQQALSTQHSALSTSPVLRMRFVGANAGAEITGEDELAGKTNYFTGNDPQQWRTDIPNYAKVRYHGIYEGVDVVFYGNQQQLEYDFVISPNADPRLIVLRFAGARRMEIDAHGELILHTAGGTVRQRKPQVYQEIDGQKQIIAGRYVILRKNIIGFAVADYDHTQPLIIDPVLSYSTYLGGSADTFGTSIAVDASGSAYITGSTSAVDFPTVNPFQATSTGQAGFVTKLNPAGTAFVYSTYLGFPNTFPSSIKVDAQGSAFVAGWTLSSNFPTTPGAYRNTPPGGGRPSFITKLSPNGASLSYSTYFAGVVDLTGLALDSSGNAYVTGYTQEASFPTTTGAYKTTLGDGISQNAFVTKLNAAGSSLVYSTFVGASVPVAGAQAIDQANAIAVDSSGNAYITGVTVSNNYPVTSGAFQTFPSLRRDAFVTKLNASGSALIYSSYLGGSGQDAGTGIAVDGAGNAYVTGAFEGGDFPFTPNAFRNGADERCCGSFTNSFLTKVNPTGTALVYSTALGYGNAAMGGSGVAVGSDGSAYAIGSEGGGMSVYAVNAVQAASHSNDAFILKMNPAGTGLAYSTPLGGNGIGNRGSSGSAIAVDAAGNAYITGSTTEADFPVTSGAPQATKPGGASFTAFVAKIGVQTNDCPAITINPQPLPTAIFNQSYNQQLTATGGTAPYTFSLAPNFGSNFLPNGLTLAADGTISGTPTMRNFGVYLVTVQAVAANGCIGVRTLKLVLAEHQSQLEVSVLGRGAILRGRENRYTFAYTNNGDADAFMVPLIIRIPRYFTWRPDFRLLPTIQPLQGPPIDYSQVPLDYQKGEQTIVPLLLPIIRARSTGSISIIITIPDRPEYANINFQIEAQLGSPLLNTLLTSPGAPQTANNHSFSRKLAPHISGVRADRARRQAHSGMSPEVFNPSTDCLQDLTQIAFDVLGLVPGTSCAQQITLFIYSQAAAYTQQVIGLSTGQNAIAGTLAGTLTGAITTGLGCALASSPLGFVVATAQLSIDLVLALPDCFPPGDKFRGRTVSSVDPNDKAGASGVGVPRYLNGDTPFPYIIHFENQATATAPAQDVVITDQLDVTKFDLNTFSFGDVTIGNLRLAVLPNKRDFYKDFDLRPANNIIARINANLDTATGVVTWRFQSIDPATGLPTNDPLAGILPPNTAPPRGEGSVMFTVKAKSNLVTGAEIRNQARIVFDTNAPIDTPVWLNTLDNSIPTSSVAPLPAQQTTHSFTVNWSGLDTGSGISGYTVFVAENGAPFTAWLTNTPAPSAIYYGGDNKTYAFYTVARDAAGNLEAVPAVADAITRTPAGNPIQEARWFVRQHYVDFLAREPDDAGLQYWTGQITDCGANAACVSARRIGVSAAFFVELEYQESAAYVYRLYKAAYGEQTLYRPPYAQFFPDRQRVVGGATLNQGKLDFANLFVTRGDFLTRYPSSMGAAQFVDAILATVQQGANVVFTGAERNAFINDVNTGGRGLMMKNLGDNVAFKQAVFNRAFVLTQYFGYLRRDPDQGGYEFWLNILNQQPANARGMVCAFITSAEYQLRFSSLTPRSNAECAGNP